MKNPRQELNAVLDEAEQQKLFGSIELEVRGGRITVIRTTKTDRFDTGEQTQNANRSSYR
jgi:hypothetical protein